MTEPVKPIRDPDARCANCGAAAPSAYCPECGQKTALHAASMREFLHETVGQYIAIEGKLWRTLALLTLRPGKLTTEYLQGRRNRYIIPLRLYLSASFLFFFIVKIAVPSDVGPNTTLIDANGVVHTRDASVTRDGPKLTIKPADSADGPKLTIQSADPGDGPKLTIKAADPGDEPVVIDLPTDIDLESHFHCSDAGRKCSAWKLALERTVAAYRKDPTRERARFVERLENNVSYALFAMLPVFAFLMALVYRNRHLYFGAHVVFALHLHSFWFLAALIVSFLPKELSDWATLGVFGYGLWAMHQVYRGRWFPTVLRALVVSTIYSCAVVTTTMLLIGYLFLT